MKILATLLLIIITFSSNAQENKDTISRNRNEMIFENLKKLEDPRKEKVSIGDQSRNYKKFKGEIILVDEHTIKFDDKILIVNNTNSELKRVFQIGILYPDLFVEASMKTNAENDSLLSVENNDDSGIIVIKLYRKDFSNFFCNRSDSLTITDFTLSKSFNESPTKRRFDFLLFYKGFANPTEYSIELTNVRATKGTDIKSFIDGAILTKIIEGSIQI